MIDVGSKASDTDAGAVELCSRVIDSIQTGAIGTRCAIHVHLPMLRPEGLWGKGRTLHGFHGLTHTGLRAVSLDVNIIVVPVIDDDNFRRDTQKRMWTGAMIKARLS